ncbi:hypothetical protein [Halobacillus sp. Marseille-Q1614]|uniref:hypothetical protein n=1 Tax=Halobacillus sp. Marseille-Q1614 TaxID=2709134 RepID=UPI00156FD0DD|nr:hypothetical protein [Halobacillus sp. Marseille-Q1614]
MNNEEVLAEEDDVNEELVDAEDGDNIYHSSEFILSILLKEYEFELHRKNTIESRTGILITLSSGLLTFAISKIELSKIDALNMELTSNKIFLILYALLALGTLFFWLCSTVLSVIVLVALRYKRFDVGALKEEHEINKVDVMASSFLELYKEILSKNQAINNKKALFFNLSLIAVVLTVPTTIGLYCLSINL